MTLFLAKGAESCTMKPTKKMHMRVYIILFLVVIIGFGTVFGSLVNIQIFKGKEYRDLASEMCIRDRAASPTRTSTF